MIIDVRMQKGQWKCDGTWLSYDYLMIISWLSHDYLMIIIWLNTGQGIQFSWIVASSPSTNDLYRGGIACMNPWIMEEIVKTMWRHILIYATFWGYVLIPMPKIVTESFCGCDANSWRSHRDILHDAGMPVRFSATKRTSLTSWLNTSAAVFLLETCHCFLNHKSWLSGNDAVDRKVLPPLADSKLRILKLGSTDQPQTCCLFPMTFIPSYISSMPRDPHDFFNRLWFATKILMWFYIDFSS